MKAPSFFDKFIITNARHRRLAEILALLAIIFTALIWRRPDQMLHPYIWVEEGTHTLPDYARIGWLSAFSPVAGYLVLPAKIIFLAAATISFDHLVTIEYWLTVLFTFGVCATIAWSPTHLKFPFLCAIAPLFIPTNSEVFAVSEYAFWWGTLLAMPPLFWKGEKNLSLRCSLTALSGLSSPLIIPLSLLFGIRAYWLRKREDYIVLMVSVATASIQYGVMWATGTTAKHSALSFSPSLVVVKFFGWYASTWHPLLIGLLVIALLAITLIRTRDIILLLILGCMAGSILASISRVPISSINPALAGPRYFFFPYIFLSWSLIYVSGLHDWGWQRIGALIFLLLSIPNFVHIGQRRHQRISWSHQVASCKKTDVYSIPVHFDGSNHTWSVNMTGADCRRLSDDSLFDKRSQ